MSSPLSERNERHSRIHAMVLAVALHFALGTLLYLYTNEEPAPQLKKQEPVKMEKERTQPQPKTVNMP